MCRYKKDGCKFLYFLLVAHFAILVADKALANQALITVDGLSVLVGGSASEESDAQPILLSDIELEAAIISAARDRKENFLQQHSESAWREAKERALLIRLLAAQARRLHESASEEDKKNLKNEVVALIGGVSLMNQFLTRIGMEHEALDKWIENAVLAINQIRFFRDQTPGTRVMKNSKSPSRRKSEIDNSNSAANMGVHRRITSRDLTNNELKQHLSEIVLSSYFRVLR